MVVRSEDFIWSDVNPYTYMTEWILPLLKAVAPDQKIIEEMGWVGTIDSLKGNWPPVMDEWGAIQRIKRNPYQGKMLFNPYLTENLFKRIKLPDDFTPDKLVNFFKLQPRTLRGEALETRTKALNTPYLTTYKDHSKVGFGFRYGDGSIYRVDINIPLIIPKEPVEEIEDDDDWTQLLFHEGLGLQITFHFNNKDVTITYGLYQSGILSNAVSQNTFDILELYLNPKKPPFMNWFTEVF